MAWGEAALWWLPTVAVAAMSGVAWAAVASASERPGRRRWMAGVLAAAAIALLLSAWQQTRSRAVLADEAARLQQLGTRLDEVGRLLPAGPGTTPGETFDTVTTAIVSLSAKIKDLEGQIQTLQEKSKGRAIPDDAAAKMAEALRQAGSYRVVMSCVPDDVEAFSYANQIANVLRAAGWDALGPETTTIFGETPPMGLALYMRPGVSPPDSVRVLFDAFGRFNIPYQSGITPSTAIPDPATVEVFVGHKP